MSENAEWAFPEPPTVTEWYVRVPQTVMPLDSYLLREKAAIDTGFKALRQSVKPGGTYLGGKLSDYEVVAGIISEEPKQIKLYPAYEARLKELEYLIEKPEETPEELKEFMQSVTDVREKRIKDQNQRDEKFAQDFKAGLEQVLKVAKEKPENVTTAGESTDPSKESPKK